MSDKQPSQGFERSNILIVGTGLIGTSIGLALRRRLKQVKIAGWDPARGRAAAARRKGALDRVAPTLEAALREVDTVVLAAPLEAIVRLVPQVLAQTQTRAFIIEVGPLLAPVVAAAAPALRLTAGERQFVAGHPLAGAESSGPQGANAEMFGGRPFALYAPPQKNRAAASRRAQSFARLLGAVPVRLKPSDHDRIVAATSALPQVASLALALAAKRAGGRAANWVSGPGFDSATRLAQSPFSVWEAPLRANARSTARALRALEDTVRAFRRALESGDFGKIEAYFAAAAAARRRIMGIRSRRAATRNS